MNTTATNQQQQQQPVDTGTLSGAQAPGNISPEVLQQVYQHALTTLISDPDFARQLATSFRESRRELDATQLRKLKYGFSHVSSNLFEKEWKEEKFTGCGIPPTSSNSQHFKSVKRSKTNFQFDEITLSELKDQYSSTSLVIWLDDTNGHLYIQTNEKNCSWMERKRKQAFGNTPNTPNTFNTGCSVLYTSPVGTLRATVTTAGVNDSWILFENGTRIQVFNNQIVRENTNNNFPKLGLPTLGDICYNDPNLLDAIGDPKIFNLGHHGNTNFFLFYSQGNRERTARNIENNNETQFCANCLYGAMATPSIYQNWFDSGKMPRNERVNSFMPVQCFLMYLNGVNAHYRVGDNGYEGYVSKKHELFIPKCDEVLILIKTLVVNFNVNRERSIPHNLPYFDCEGGTNESQFKKWTQWHNEQYQKKNQRINNAITAWSTCTPTGPVDMFGHTSNGTGSAPVPGGNSPFGKTGGAADGLSQLSWI